MGTIGDSYDNAMAESLSASLEKELIYRTTFSTRKVSRTAIFAFINWYNRKRRHSSIDYASPNGVRRKRYATSCTGKRGSVSHLVSN
jgi:transposase InsO family protein